MTLETISIHGEVPQMAEAEALHAVDAFASTLRATPEFVAWDLAGDALAADADAQAAIRAVNARQQELRVELMLGTASEAAKADLARLREEVFSNSSVRTYVGAREAFRALVLEMTAVVSAEAGIDFAANSRAGGCCG